jgi:hypothetical protein
MDAKGSMAKGEILVETQNPTLRVKRKRTMSQRYGGNLAHTP